MDALSDARSPSASPAQARPPSLGFFTPAKARALIAKVAAAIRRWPDFATPAGVPADWTRRVATAHRLPLTNTQR